MQLGPDYVLLLNCTMYGLNEAMADFDAHFAAVFQGDTVHEGKPKLSMRRGLADPSLFYNEERTVLVSKHVDDGLIIGPGSEIDAILVQLGAYFLLKVTEPLEQGRCEQYLGRLVTKVPGGFHICCRPTLIQRFLEITGMTNAAPVATPGIKLEARVAGEKELDAQAASQYRAAAGLLLFISLERFDLAYATKECARGMTKPTVGDKTRIKRVARYLRSAGDMFQELTRRACDDNGDGEDSLVAEVDSDWAADKIERKSTSAGVLFFNRIPVQTWSRTQEVIALSSGEAEAYALVSGAKELLGASAILKDIGIEPSLTLASDSTSAISMHSRPGLGRNKHIQIKYLFLQQLVARKALEIKKISTHLNSADLGTKYLEKHTFSKLREQVRIIDDRTVNSVDECDHDQQSNDKRRIQSFSEVCTGLHICFTGLASVLHGSMMRNNSKV